MSPAGLLSVQSLALHDSLRQEQLSSDERKAYFLPMEITNEVFIPALHNPASEDYQTMYKEVSDVVR